METALPFAVFMAFPALYSAFGNLFQTSDRLLFSRPHYWIFPLQTAVCAGLLVFWKSYPFLAHKDWPSDAVAGVVAFVIWISPQALFGGARTASQRVYCEGS